MNKEYNRWNIIIGGLFRDERKPTGIFKLYNKIRLLSKKNDYVGFYTWNENWYSVARKIFLTSQLHKKPAIVNIAAFSWGTFGVTQLARYLNKFDISVRNVVITDPVYKMKWIPFFTLFSHNVYLPINIENIIYFKQENTFPNGHNIFQKTVYGYKLVNGYIVKDTSVIHEDMDSLSQFHDKVVEVMILQK